MGNKNLVSVVCERFPNENKCPAVLQRHTFWISIVLMKPVRSWIVLCYSRSDLLLKDFMSFFKLFIPSKCNFFDTVYSVVCTVHHGIKHFVFKSKMSNSITVLQVEPYSCPSGILFQFSWGKVWSKTFHKVSMQLLKPSPTVCATSILVMGSVNSFWPNLLKISKFDNCTLCPNKTTDLVNYGLLALWSFVLVWN